MSNPRTGESARSDILHGYFPSNQTAPSGLYISQGHLPEKASLASIGAGSFLHEAHGTMIPTSSGQATPRSRSTICEEPRSDGVVVELPERLQAEVVNAPSCRAGISGNGCREHVLTDKRITFSPPSVEDEATVRTTERSHDIRRRHTGMGRGKYPMDYIVDPALREGNVLDGGSYLRLHLLTLASK